MLHKAIQNLHNSATGFDAWSFADLKWLLEEAWDALALILRRCEIQGWPTELATSTLSLIPKDENDLRPIRRRPITVTPTLYRVWATACLPFFQA